MDLSLFIVFVLAAFVGAEVISKVPATLHTPLMSGSNAVSGITIVGAIVAAGAVADPVARWLGVLALVLATVNVVGGYLVTDRMLEMFKPRVPAPPAAPPAAPSDAPPASGDGVPSDSSAPTAAPAP